MLLNDLFDLKLTRTNLFKYTSLLVSDCSFFLFNKCSLVSGIGDIIKPINLPLNDYYIVIVKPTFNCSTKDMFSKYKLNQDVRPYVDFSDNPDDWKQEFVNDLESVAFSLYPELVKLKNDIELKSFLWQLLLQ